MRDVSVTQAGSTLLSGAAAVCCGVPRAPVVKKLLAAVASTSGEQRLARTSACDEAR